MGQVGNLPQRADQSSGVGDWEEHHAHIIVAFQLAAIKAKVVKGPGYEPYPTLVSRTIAGEEKMPLLSAIVDNGSSEGQNTSNSKMTSKQEIGKLKRKAP